MILGQAVAMFVTASQPSVTRSGTRPCTAGSGLLLNGRESRDLSGAGSQAVHLVLAAGEHDVAHSRAATAQ